MAIVSLCIFGTSGCSRDECDEELVDEAIEFLDSHQQCQTDHDCAVGHVGCSDLPGSFCGQVTLNREAAQSQKWQFLEQELGSCSSADDDCAICEAALLPGCTQGSCRGPR